MAELSKSGRMSTPPPSPPSVTGPRTTWRPRLPGGGGSLTLPLLLIAAGLIAFLVNFGWVPGDRLLRALDLWPLVLVVGGVVLVLRSLFQPFVARALALVALALAIAAVVAYVALAPPATALRLIPANSSAPLGSAENGRLQIELGAVELEVHADSSMSDLYQARFGYPSGQAPQVQVDHGTVIVRGARSSNFGFLQSFHHTASITLNGSIPWDVKIGGGASQTQLDLRGLDLRSLTVDSGASHLDVRLPSPKGTVQVAISGGASNVTITRPSQVPVEARISGGASNLVVDNSQIMSLGGDGVHTTPGYGSAGGRYQVRVSGGANNVRIQEER
jgi:Domain of unknown function (DUF5668)